MKKYISLFMVLFLSSCNVKVDIEPIKNKLNEIADFRNSYVVNKFSYRSEVKNLHTIEKTTYNVSIEDKYMYYEYEYQSLGEIEGYRSDQYWIYQENDEYVLVDKMSSYLTNTSKIPVEDFSFIELIDDLQNKTPVYQRVKKFSSFVPYLFLDLDFLIDLINNDVKTFTENYSYVIDEDLNKVEINRNNTTKYIYQNNILKYCEYSSSDEHYLDLTRYYISDEVNIVYP